MTFDSVVRSVALRNTRVDVREVAMLRAPAAEPNVAALGNMMMALMGQASGPAGGPAGTPGHGMALALQNLILCASCGGALAGTLAGPTVMEPNISLIPRAGALTLDLLELLLVLLMSHRPSLEKLSALRLIQGMVGCPCKMSPRLSSSMPRVWQAQETVRQKLKPKRRVR